MLSVDILLGSNSVVTRIWFLIEFEHNIIQNQFNSKLTLHKKWSFPWRISSVNVIKSAGNLVTFTDEILNGKLHFLCSAKYAEYINCSYCKEANLIWAFLFRLNYKVLWPNGLVNYLLCKSFAVLARCDYQSVILNKVRAQHNSTWKLDTKMKRLNL